MNEETFDRQPAWLKHIQENSWEAEVLISGGAIFSMVQLISFTVQESFLLKEKMTLPVSPIFIFLHLGINGIIIGFAFHLILRSFWIALIGLYHAYPSGIDFNRLKLKGSYLQKAHSVDLLTQIKKINQLTGLIFFGSITYALIVLGLAIVSFLPFLLLDSLPLVYSFSIVIFFFDFFTGLLRRNQLIGVVFKPIYFFFNILTLAFIYRPWLQILFSNVNKWKVAVGVVFFAMLSVIITNRTISDVFRFQSLFDSRKHLPRFNDVIEYENRMTDGDYIRWACIQSEIIPDDYLRVFVPYKATYDELIDERKATRLDEIIAIKIDDKVYDSLRWHWDRHFLSKQEGIFTMIEISALPKSKHQVSVEVLGHGKPFPVSIPFWKQ